MQADSSQIDRIITDLRNSVGGNGAPPTPPPFTGPGGDGNGGDMEPRIAKLEAQTASISAELAKLGSIPADVATLKERTAHMPTKADMSTAIDTAIDKAATRTQRTIMVVGGLTTIAIGLLNLGSRLIP